ncbi:hypothetical protein [Sulfolobus acidocaldarius]|uniref:Conserved membrane protein n=4 Tax=Sulfolobus acidocaldarius TaxID=2285 RepID=F2Z5W9_SULAC|nr:hypothetical protein [Sulfolobus acidocaldarius]AAY80383.1 conserved membrane protein [Sulfolobus acidocaldarius DSM 639]AGE70966.1 hypothetical protein SacN8_04975 [Sulfolobus acidocaldarius N8]AGE73237.1 hypothetical protein SacRon12I_04965 [Sulfolobus acidocaldarius Ron12/I]ALU28730.1 hypothetical protein ATY89_01330 [Sulfolobus acidocaldarius]ALU31449.1 hypothetical protein ATZ20_04365 [Sulfolobus acidocaldarius]
MHRYTVIGIGIIILAIVTYLLVPGLLFSSLTTTQQGKVVVLPGNEFNLTYPQNLFVSVYYSATPPVKVTIPSNATEQSNVIAIVKSGPEPIMFYNNNSVNATINYTLVYGSFTVVFAVAIIGGLLPIALGVIGIVLIVLGVIRGRRKAT